ncbi:MAG: hypothetical protein KME11_02630 [Timaviella obliquedivisa GSE-PSE-MK23-08B]|jgi:hypothetical protein|nr:hypothetical protein [Timaviella obliquedivisa GSE-PSE-MK23-08B]
MKTRFLCLLGLVTVMVSYAPLARADEALHFDKSSTHAAPPATEGSIWMATDPILKKENSDATTTVTNEGTEALPVAIAPDSTASELSVKSANKLGDTVSKEAPAQPVLSFAEPPTSVGAPVAQSGSTQAESVQAEPIQDTLVQPTPIQPAPVQPPAPSASRKPIELGFSLSPTEPLYEPEQGVPSVAAAPQEDANLKVGVITDKLFTGNTNSLVAKAVGSAEGTRTPEGDRTHAYYGHVDPGNQVWNRGSFSYQHSAQSPEDADQKQLSRLADQAKVIEAKAADHGLQLTLEEKLNGIDLANQAPKAALDQGGYVDWLAQARQQGMSGSDAVLWARTRAFINPATQRWDAPGLGNTAETIGHDQARRMAAIARAIAVNQDAVKQAINVASLPDPTAANAASSPTKAAVTAQSTSSTQAGQGIAQLLAEKIVELFGGDQVPADSSPVANEPMGIQQLFGFAF